MPATNAIGSDLRRAATAAVNEVNTIMWNVIADRSKSGAINTPAQPASSVDRAQMMREERSVSMPRNLARTGRSTPARVSSPRRVRRMRNHRPNAATAATATTAS
jgi:hypothetical protein